MEGEDVGYIRISTFSEQTFDGLRKGIEKAIADAPGDKLKGFIIDLRNNRGGRLDQAVLVSDAFLDRGEIVSTRGRNSDETQRFSAKPGDLSRGKPVIVLINGGSASAAEIVAGAIQDHKRGKVMGTRSFGKGSVQTIIPMGSNGALRLTTARYYTPSGKSIQAKGIDPDLVVLQEIPDELKGKDETKGEAGLKGHLSGAAGTKSEEEKSGSSSYIPADKAKDKQLNAALDLLRGIKRDAAAPSDPAAPATKQN
jgi:carboxyl-terminal processing protease